MSRSNHGGEFLAGLIVITIVVVLGYGAYRFIKPSQTGVVEARFLGVVDHGGDPRSPWRMYQVYDLMFEIKGVKEPVELHTTILDPLDLKIGDVVSMYKEDGFFYDSYTPLVQTRKVN